MAFHDHRLALVFGLLGNVVSFLVYLAPLPTFYRIFRKKSTEGFQSVPYSVALFSAMLLLYYASLKDDAHLLITFNSIGCVIESSYLTFYMIYATKSSRVFTTKLLILFNIGAYGLIVLLTFLLAQGSLRVNIVGWIWAVFSVSVFAAPLSIIRLVIKTKSVEFMPFTLSFFLTVCALCWLVYGLLLHDYYIATPNILGLIFGSTQMILYFIYKNRRSEILPETQPQELEDAAKTCKDVKGPEFSNVNPNQPQAIASNNVGGAANKLEEPCENNV
ncbi:hypothetical protein K2173_026206 [Erythroxylum novogranatense]|uniref:Bidirectional sugar transporter SWEET n=1 Tax=Erythroxylum novogranatense TaxID=1862640 RepID=A0AAV8SBG3_9ROSI|nr:hypothetical protein K2173_026206 [Erythroxylum novogranatense]